MPSTSSTVPHDEVYSNLDVQKLLRVQKLVAFLAILCQIKTNLIKPANKGPILIDGNVIIDGKLIVKNKLTASQNGLMVCLAHNLTLPDLTLAADLALWKDSGPGSRNSKKDFDLSTGFFTAPMNGMYLINVQVTWDNKNNAGSRFILLVLEQTDELITQHIQECNGSKDIPTVQTLSCACYLLSGQRIKVQVDHDSAKPVTVQHQQTRLSITY